MTTRNSKFVLLNEQYRIHKDIMDFPNTQYYHGNLLVGCHSSIDYLQTGQIIIFIDTGEEIKYSVSSYKNESAAKATLHLLRYLLYNRRIKAEDITILTPYRAQRNLLRKKLEKK